eukprot:4032649-Pyramimonas_sp.AAC.1
MKYSYSFPLQVGSPGANIVAVAKSSQPRSIISSGPRFQSPPKRNGQEGEARSAQEGAEEIWQLEVLALGTDRVDSVDRADDDPRVGPQGHGPHRHSMLPLLRDLQLGHSNPDGCKYSNSS